MNDIEFRCFLDLLMCSDPWPINDEISQNVMMNLADQESHKRRFPDWISAYHVFKVQE